MTKRFTEAYIEYANEFTDCPDAFLLWGALLAISASLSRSVYVEIGSWNISPHIWVVLVGKSSSHKSTALAITEDLIEVVSPDRLASHEFTSEAIIHSLSSNPVKLFCFDEAKSFFDTLGKSYNESLKSLFTILYRKPNYTRTTLKHGTLSIQGAYIPMGLATTPEWLKQSLQEAEQSVLSGFLARFIFVPFFGKGNDPMSMPPPHDSMKFKALSEMLLAIRRIDQPFTYAPDALLALDGWYKETTLREDAAFPALGPFFEHFKNEAIHKLSVLLAIDKSEIVISAFTLLEAIECLRYVEDNLPALMEDMTSDRRDQSRRKVSSFIKEKAVCRREDVSNAVRIYGEDLTRILVGLEADGKIVTRKDKGKTKMITVIEWVGGKE